MAFKYDWWLVPPNAAIEMRGEEHVETAIRVLMSMSPDAVIPKKWHYSAIPEDELILAEARGADKNAVNYLRRESNDPRIFLIQKLHFIRVARGKFNLWKFDDEALDLIRNAKEFWRVEDPFPEDMIDIDEVSTNQMFSLSVKKVLNPSAEPDALKNFATGVGRFRNPPRQIKKRRK